MKNIAVPSIDLSVNFKPEQKEICKACYHDLMAVYKDMNKKTLNSLLVLMKTE